MHGPTITLPVPEQKILDTSKTTLLTAKEKTKLEGFGFDAAFYTEFERDIAIAASFKPNEKLKEDLKSLTREKNKKLVDAGAWGDGVKLRFELAFEEKPEVLSEFPENFKEAKNDEKLMLEVIPTICDLIDKYTVELKKKGLPDDYKQKGLTLMTELDDKNKVQEKTKWDKPEYTVHRLEAYMKLYKTVNKINKAGRRIYSDDPAALKIFESPWPAAEKKSDEEDKKKNTDEKKQE
jgi:hypothetical protein